MPELVAYEENGVDAQSLDYARLVAILIEAIKEQQGQAEDQEATIAALTSRLDAMERKVGELSALESDTSKLASED